jgi:phosphoglycerol transferase MdoB-like AlkP superfamily enzyme
MKQYKIYLKPFYNLLCLYLIVCGLLRLILLFNPVVTGSFSAGTLLKIFLLGALSNAFVFFQVGIFLWCYLLFLSDNKYKRPYGLIIFCFWAFLFLYVTCFHTILNEYGSILPLLAAIALGWKISTFGSMLLFHRQRAQIRIITYSFWIFVFVSLILLNALSEYFFFNEFGVRYNFIAVDYLVYTNEVIGDIMESYPVIPLFTVLGLLSLGITWVIVRSTRRYLDHLPGWKQKGKLLCLEVAFVLVGWWAIPALAGLEPSGNKFASELQADGLYKFYIAYTQNKLDYFEFYPTIPHNESFAILSQFLPGISGFSLERNIVDSANEVHKNVILITVESLSADYMAHYGNDNHLTPFLDSLADQGLFFTNLYAAGNRTVRGLEAVTLCLPPTPGESIIKRKDNKGKFGVGYIFKHRGYSVKFLYGGYSYFDNMKDFYSGNGYEVIDRDSLSGKEITFANVWGACDEDMARKAIQVINRQSLKGRPFFDHWMTVSNHRPFTYPDGKIDIPGDSKSRNGGVKYTDYALSQFFKMAKQQPWFNNTVFIIVADHCASSAGKTTLPMSKYRIPAIVYSKNFIEPKKVTVLMSQIDLMPTIFGLLHFSYPSKFYGMDVLKEGYKPRAFIATYQDMGYIKDSILTVLSPVKQVRQYRLVVQGREGVAPEFQEDYREIPLPFKRQDLINEAVAYYQSATWLLDHKEYQR